MNAPSSAILYSHVQAFVLKRLASNLPLFYLGLAPDAISGENVLKARIDSLSTEVEAGRLKIPNVSSEEKMPADQAVPLPPLPHLESLVFDLQEKVVKVLVQGPMP